MKNISKLSCLAIAMLMSATLMTNCTKNDDTTIVLLGQEQYIEDILAVIPDTLIDVFNEQFGNYVNGYIPPNIEGEYLFSPKRRKATSVNTQLWPIGIVEPDVKIKFTGQHNRMVTFIHFEENETKTDTVYVIGKNSNFTVYYQENKSLDYGWYEIMYKRGIIYTGIVKDDGIYNLKYASIIMEVEDGSMGHGAHEPWPVGSFFIYEDGSENGVAERHDWYNEE